MTVIIYFKPRKDLEAAENVRAFVEMARNRLTAFGDDLDFDSHIWDVTGHFKTRGKKTSAKQRILFIRHRKNGLLEAIPLSDPFCSFAKAYMRYRYSLNPFVSYGHAISALAALEEVLVESFGESAIELANGDIFYRTASLIQSRYNNSAYNISRHLQKISQFCTEHYLFSTPVQWETPIKLPEFGVKTGIEAEAKRNSKLPTAAALSAAPELLYLAKETSDVLTASILAILFGAPFRISEVLTLSADCEVEQEQNGKKMYGLRTKSAKGGNWEIKWIQTAMVDAVKTAIVKIRQHTDEARKIALWYEQHPDQIYLPEDLLHLRGQKRIHRDEISKLLNLATKSATGWCHIRKIKVENLTCDFEHFCREMLKLLPKKFPFFDAGIELKYSEALFTTRFNASKLRIPQYRCMIERIDKNNVRARLGGHTDRPELSMFHRFGFTESDGSPIKLNTHQPRHYLNTLAQRGNLSQIDIAKWSGRVNIHQNRDYDHMTAEELCNRLRQIVLDDINIGNLPVEIREQINDPVTREEFVSMRIPTAHVTELGFCVHDYTFTPCQLHRDCINCTEHCYIKGDEKRMDRIRKLHGDIDLLLEQAGEARRAGDYGADRWEEHHSVNLERMRNLVEIFDDPNVPDGSLIQLAAPEIPSRIRQAIDDRKLLEGEKQGKLPPTDPTWS